MKKNNALLVCCLLAFAMLGAGCSNDKIPQNVSNNSNAIDPMTASSGDETSDAVKVVTAGYGVHLDKDCAIFTDGTLKVTPTLMGDSESTVAGIVMFIDGIPQNYYTDDISDKTTLSSFEIKANSEEKHTLTIDAQIDPEAEDHYISILTMLVPDFVPTMEAPRFGNYHHSLSLWTQLLPEECNTLPKNNIKIFKTENAPLSQKQIERYRLQEEEDGGSNIDFVLRQNKDNKLENWFVEDDGDGLKLTFAGYTNEKITPQNYRVTFYKNHELCKFNGGYDALDMTLEGNKIVETEVELENVKAGDFVYCIAAPLKIKERVIKSDSMMVVKRDGTTSDKNNSQNTESNNAPDPDISDGEELSSKLTPTLAIEDTVYFTTRDNGLVLCSSKNGKDVDKKFPIGQMKRITSHGENISVLSLKNNTVYTLTLLNKDLEVLKSAEIDASQMGIESHSNIDFDEDKIVMGNHVDSKSEIRCCDWDLGNMKTLLTLPRDDLKAAQYFNGITLAEDYVAFTAFGKENNIEKSFYGVCDFSGKSEIHQKDEIATPETFGSTAVWSDMHKNYGTAPSGEIILYKDGKFETLKTKSAFESQNVYLCGENIIVTTTEGTTDNNCVLNVYENGQQAAERSLEKDASLYSIVKFGKVYFAKVVVSEKSKTVVWELN